MAAEPHVVGHDRLLSAAHVGMVCLKLVGFLLTAAWLVPRFKYHKKVDNALTLVIGVIVVVGALCGMTALVPFWSSLLSHEKVAVVAPKWILGTVWNLLFLLIILALCAMVPAWKKYIYFFL